MNDSVPHGELTIFADKVVEAHNVYILNSLALPGLIV
jgi:hypothetical protein